MVVRSGTPGAGVDGVATCRGDAVLARRVGAAAGDEGKMIVRRMRARESRVLVCLPMLACLCVPVPGPDISLTAEIGLPNLR